GGVPGRLRVDPAGHVVELGDRGDGIHEPWAWWQLGGRLPGIGGSNALLVADVLAAVRVVRPEGLDAHLLRERDDPVLGGPVAVDLRLDPLAADVDEGAVRVLRERAAADPIARLEDEDGAHSVLD